MRFHRTSILLAVCSLMLPAGIATAQQPSPQGITQAGHRAPARRIVRKSPVYCDGCCPGYVHGSGPCGHYVAAGVNGGRYGYGGNPHYSHCGIGKCLNAHSPYHVCTHPPDYGFAPPAHRPICPTPAEYSRMFPACWTGEKLAIDPHFRHPMVYMPTDTTQLGYYYQHVPYWRPLPNMIPPVPYPDEWHTPDHHVVFTGFDDAAAGAPHDIRYGNVAPHNVVGQHCDQTIGDYLMEGMPMDAAPGSMIEPQPVAPYSPAPVTPQMVPPAEEAAPAPPGVLPPVPRSAVPAPPSEAVPPPTSGAAPPVPPVAPPVPPAAPAPPDLERSASLPLLIPVPAR